MATLIALKQLLIGSIPTFILVWILYLYIKSVFYGPLEETLRKRNEATAGLRQKAEASIAQAEQKSMEYQSALRAARSEIYRVQEKERQAALEKRAGILRQAQQQAQGMISRARNELQAETEIAKKNLASETERIAASITQVILKTTPVPAGAGSPSRPEASS